MLGNHRILQSGPVAICCMDPDARDLMERAEREYGARARAGKERPTPLRFAAWLFGESGLVDDVGERAIPAWKVHMKGIRESLKGHPNPAFRRRVGRGSVHGFAYWFFRWSGLVDPRGVSLSVCSDCSRGRRRKGR